MDSSRVQRRCVFYFAGFDPSGPAHYRRMYQQEAALQAQVSGYDIEVGPRRKTGKHLASWSVTHTSKNETTPTTTHTDYVYARWDDIVRRHWYKLDFSASSWRFLTAFLATQWLYLRTGATKRMLQLSWPPIVAALSHALILVLVISLGIAAPWLTWTIVKPFFGFAHLSLPVRVIAALLCAVPSYLAIIWTVRKLEEKFHILWLIRGYLFTRQQALGQTPELDERLIYFSKIICQALESGEYDEVLVVGHSLGTVLAVEVAALSLIERDMHGKKKQSDGLADAKEPRTSFSLLTLAQLIPLLSSLPQATSFRERLKQLSFSKDIHWIDISAPPDGCCFVLVDAIEAAVPVEACGPYRAKLLSPRFQTLFNAAQYQALRKHRLDLHFQYIKASPLAGEYDYFAISAGPLRLNDRFQNSASITDFRTFKTFS
jgi:hypothetical protein